ncbi:MAG: NAD(P)/FAD-dependent oxidoreductase [Velocimicrobium sp.]
MYDVVIIGAGVIGSSIARELSKFQLNTCVLEREEDVCEGTSKANSGIVHSGFDAKPGSLKAKLNVAGSKMMEQLSKDLDFPYRKNGSIVLCFREEDIGKLDALCEQGKENGVDGIRIVKGENMKKLEPNISNDAVALLYAPTGGIVCPFNLTIAMAENANVNGVAFKFGCEVEQIEKIEEGYQLKTSLGTFDAKVIVNAAGVYGDIFNNMVSKRILSITPRRGEYCLLDKKVGDFVDKTIFQLPTKLGKGVLITPTVHGNLMIGPNANDIEDKENVETTREGIEEILEKARLSASNVPASQVITSFAGLRAHEVGDDFVIGEVSDAKGFFNAVGIESPGLSSAPAIGIMIAEQVEEYLLPPKKKNFIATRKGMVDIAHATKDRISELVKERPEYGTIVCRCEMVTEGEIIDAIKRPLGAKTMDGIKRRTRAGSGRCQAGFCTPKTMEILARELDVSPLDITKSGKQARLLVGYDKEDL